MQAPQGLAFPRLRLTVPPGLDLLIFAAGLQARDLGCHCIFLTASYSDQAVTQWQQKFGVLLKSCSPWGAELDTWIVTVSRSPTTNTPGVS